MHLCTNKTFSLIGYTGPGGIQCEVSEAVEDMGGPTADVLISSLPDHWHNCIFLVLTRTVNETAHTGSSRTTFSIIVSAQTQSHYFYPITVL